MTEQEIFISYTDPNALIKCWSSLSEAISFVEQHEAGEVTNESGVQMYVKYPKTNWV